MFLSKNPSCGRGGCPELKPDFLFWNPWFLKKCDILFDFFKRLSNKLSLIISVCSSLD